MRTKKFLFISIFLIFLFLISYSQSRYHPIITYQNNIPNLDILSTYNSELLTFGNDLTSIYLWDLQTRDTVNANYPKYLTGKLITQPKLQKFNQLGLDYLTFCVADINGLYYFHAIDFKGEEYPGFPITLKFMPVSTPVIISTDNTIQIIYGSDSGDIVIYNFDNTSLFSEPEIINTIGSEVSVYSYDIDGDSELELVSMVTVADSKYLIEYYDLVSDVWTKNSNILYYTINNITTDLIFTDINSDSNPEIVFGTDLGYILAYNVNPNFSLISGYPQQVSNDKIEHMYSLTEQEIVYITSLMDIFRFSISSFASQRILSRGYSNLYSNFPLIVTLPDNSLKYYSSQFGRDLRILSESGELETWGYFNHSILDKAIQPNIEIVSDEVHCPASSDNVSLEIDIDANSTCNTVYWCGFLYSDKNEIIPLDIPAEYTQVTDQIGSQTGTSISDGILSVPYSSISSGKYTLLVLSQDDLGGFNYSTKEVTFLFQNSAVADLTSPGSGEIIDTESSGLNINLIGSANFIKDNYQTLTIWDIGYDFEYSLFYSNTNTPQNEIIITTSTLPINDSTLCDWDLSLVPSGKYYIRLQVDVSDGTNTYQEESTNVILIDKEHPNVIVSNLTNDQAIHNTYSVEGTVFDPNLVSFQAYITPTGTEFWSPMTDIIYDNKNNELLFDFESNLYEDGYYDLKIIATDLAGKSTIYSINNIRIFNEPINVALLTDRYSLSPNGDKCNDYIDFTLSSDNMDNIQSAYVNIHNSLGNLVRTLYFSDIYSMVRWNGWDDQQNILPEGVYTCNLIIISISGKVTSAEQKYVSISYSDQVLVIFNEETEVDNDKFNIQADINPTENKILYLKTNYQYFEYPATLFYPKYLNCVVASNCSIWEKNLTTGVETMLVDKQYKPWPWPFPEDPLYMTKSPQYSPDGTKFMFIRGWKLQEYNNGIITTIQKPDSTIPLVYKFDWHPIDSNKFVYIENYEYPQKLYIVNGASHTEIFSGDIDEVIWSDNGNYIIFSGYPSHASFRYIYTYNINTGTLNIVQDDINPKRSLALSPDSRKLAYTDIEYFSRMDLRVLYLTSDGLKDTTFIENPKVVAPEIHLPLMGENRYETFNWTRDNKWLMYGYVTEIPMLKAIDLGLIGPGGQPAITPGEPEYWDIRIEAVDEYGNNRQIIEDHIKTLVYDYKLTPNANVNETEKIGGGRPDYLELNNSYLISKYTTRESDVVNSIYVTANSCISTEGNVPGIVTSFDDVVQVDVGASALEQPIDVLMITPLVLPMDDPASDMTDIQPVLSEVYDIKLISNQPAFTDYVALTFSYSDTQIAGIDETSINVYTYDEDLQTWSLAQPEPSLVYKDLNNNEITIYTEHLSLYVLSGKIADEDSPSILTLDVTNNPFSPNGDTVKDKIYFNTKSDQDSTINLVVYDSSWNTKHQNSVTAVADTIVTFNWNGKDTGGIIQSDGMYYAEVFAVNSGGLRSTSAYAKIYIDNSPPAISISGVQNGGVYNTDIIPEILIVDAFPLFSSITLNGMPYVIGTPISNEGNYLLSVSAEDQAGNTSQVSLQFLIDKTPTLSSIAYEPFSIQDDEISIVPETEFVITSVDQGNPPSGLFKSEYKIKDTDFYDTGWLNYTEPFTMENYESGLWTIVYRGIDNAGNIEEGKELDISIGELLDEENSNLTSGTVCLVWLDYDEYDEQSPEVIKLKELLDEAFNYYTIVFAKDDFISEFRTNFYHVYLILGKDDALGSLPADELKEHIRMGRGIVSARFRNFPGEGNESEMFGIKFKGHYPGNIHTISIADALILNTSTVSISGQIERLEPINENVITAAYYEVNNSSTPVITMNKYGEGTAIYYAFDFMDAITQENKEPLADILRNSVSLVRRPIMYIFPGAKFPVQLNLKSGEINADLKVREETPGDMEILLTIPEADIQNVNSVEWYFSITPNEEKILLSINRLPTELGYYEIYFEVYNKVSSIYNLHTTFLYGFEIEFEKGLFINNLIFDLIQLAVEPEEQKDLEDVIQGLQDINQLTPTTKDEYLNIIKDLFTLKEKLQKITSISTLEQQNQISTLILYYETRI